MINKHSIIVGGTKGVGHEVAELLATAGQTVTVVGRSAVAMPGSRIEAVAGNVEVVDSVLEALVPQIARRGQVSSLVFLQRYRGNGDSWAGELAVSMTATKALIEGLIPHFDREGDRSICIVTSNAGTFVARNQSLGYHTSKAALRQMARFFAVKYGPRGIRVNVVAPCTFVKSESAAYYSSQHELELLYKRVTPLARMGTAHEVAKAVAFLCSPDASFITGHELVVDGGLSLMMQDSLARDVAGME